MQAGTERINEPLGRSPAWSPPAGVVTLYGSRASADKPAQGLRGLGDSSVLLSVLGGIMVLDGIAVQGHFLTCCWL